MENRKVVIAGGGVLGTQIGLICAYHGFDTTFWLRSEGSVGRTMPKIERYSALMLEDLANAKTLIGNPIGGMLYPRGLIRSWQGVTSQDIDTLIEEGKKNLAEKVHIELDLKKALSGAYIVIESMTEEPKAKIGMYEAMKDLLDEDTILCTNSSTLLPSMFAEYTGRPEKYCALHFANTIWKNNTGEVMGHPGTDSEIYEKVVEFASARLHPELDARPLPLCRAGAVGKRRCRPRDHRRDLASCDERAGRTVPDPGYRGSRDRLQHQPDEAGGPAGRHAREPDGQASEGKDRQRRDRSQRRQGLLRLFEKISVERRPQRKRRLLPRGEQAVFVSLSSAGACEVPG